MPLPPLQLAVTFRNSFKEDIREFEVTPWELHLRGANVLIDNKQSARLQRLFNLVENVFKLKNMMQRACAYTTS